MVATNPKVSVGMPVFNGEETIAAAIESVLDQSFVDFELIISDNASTDGTADICNEFANLDRRIKYYRQEDNIGPVNNFQFVLDKSIGEYFLWAAADDLRHRNAFSLSVEVLDSANDIGLVFSDMSVFDYLTGHSQKISCGYSGDTKKYRKLFFRWINLCPSLIYGMHRLSVLREFGRIPNFDYSDVHMSIWYELKSKAVTIPLDLYTAGTMGSRIPYSLTGAEISITDFLMAQRKILRENFNYTSYLILYCLTSVLFRIANFKNNLRRKKMIAEHLEIESKKVE